MKDIGWGPCLSWVILLSTQACLIKMLLPFELCCLVDALLRLVFPSQLSLFFHGCLPCCFGSVWSANIEGPTLSMCIYIFFSFSSPRLLPVLDWFSLPRCLLFWAIKKKKCPCHFIFHFWLLLASTNACVFGVLKVNIVFGFSKNLRNWSIGSIKWIDQPIRST